MQNKQINNRYAENKYKKPSRFPRNNMNGKTSNHSKHRFSDNKQTKYPINRRDSIPNIIEKLTNIIQQNNDAIKEASETIRKLKINKHSNTSSSNNDKNTKRNNTDRKIKTEKEYQKNKRFRKNK